MAKQGLMDEAGYEPVVDEIAFDDGFKKGVEWALEEYNTRLHIALQKSNFGVVGHGTYDEVLENLLDDFENGRCKIE